MFLSLYFLLSWVLWCKAIEKGKRSIVWDWFTRETCKDKRLSRKLLSAFVAPTFSAVCTIYLALQSSWRRTNASVWINTTQLILERGVSRQQAKRTCTDFIFSLYYFLLRYVWSLFSTNIKIGHYTKINTFDVVLTIHIF